jgi:hypothetical protein
MRPISEVLPCWLAGVKVRKIELASSSVVTVF